MKNENPRGRWQTVNLGAEILGMGSRSITTVFILGCLVVLVGCAASSPIDPCSDIACGDFSSCVSDSGSARCECDPGFVIRDGRFRLHSSRDRW